MRRYFFPLVIFTAVLTFIWGAIFFWIPPVNGWVVLAFFLTSGVALASLSSFGIYYLRRIWGRKDSPRYVLRTSLRQGFFLSLAVVGFLLLELFSAVNPVTIIFLLGLVVVMERLT